MNATRPPRVSEWVLTATAPSTMIRPMTAFGIRSSSAQNEPSRPALTRCEGWYTMSDVTTCDILIRLSDLRVEESLEGRETNLRSFATNIGWTVQRVVVENDVTADGKSKPASAWKRRKIRTPSGRTELRTVRPGFREV